MNELKLRVILEPCKKAREWRVVESVQYRCVKVESGFITDLSSIPIGLRWMFPHGGAKAFGSVIHDHIYRKQYLPRNFADDFFLDAMLENGVNKYKANAMYAGVRLFGWIAWESNKKKLESECQKD